MHQQLGRPARHAGGWVPVMEWIVLGRALGHGLLKGSIYGAIAGFPFALIGAAPGALVGAFAGLASALLPGVMLAARAELWRVDLLRARSRAAALAAAPWVGAAIYFASKQPVVPLGLLGCAVVAGVTVALLTRRLLNGPRVMPGVVVGEGAPYRQTAA